MKVAELTGAQLDYWVARAEDEDLGPDWNQGPDYVMIGGHSGASPERYSPSTDWAHGGPIIQREQIGMLSPNQSPVGLWQASYLHPDFWDFSDSDPLVAAMRCYIAKKFGDDVPDEVT